MQEPGHQPSAQAQTTSRLSRLQSYLKADPTNANLLADAAQAAFDEGDLAAAQTLLDQLAPLTPQMRNLSGLVALAAQRFGDAATIFQSLMDETPGDAALRFNLAWSKAMLGDFVAAAALLGDGAASATPAAARLLVQSLHHLGQLEEALAAGEALLKRFPADAPFLGALAALAIDADDNESAKRYAIAAGEQSDGLAALGMLSLEADDYQKGMALFERALALAPNDARAQLGLGLGLMVEGNFAAAPEHLDRAADLFKTHAGSWSAAGWAYFIANDLAASRKRFETALALDDTSAESHGALALLAILAGDLASGRKHVDVALLLDRECLPAAIAKSLLLAGKDSEIGVQRLRDLVMNSLGASGGQTLARALAAMARRRQ